MLGVAVLHILLRSELLVMTHGVTHFAVWLLEKACYPAVNCYAIISGFVMYSDEEKPHRCTKYISLWTQVAFWSIAISVVGFALNACDAKTLVKSFVPVISNEYWYFSAYTVLFFLVPFINKLIRTLSKKEAFTLSAVLFVAFSVVGLVKNSESINYGYSTAWLAVMYVFGAVMKKYSLHEKIKTLPAVLISAFCVLFGTVWYLYSPISNNIAMQYNSPTTVVYAVLLFAIFAKLGVGQGAKRLISFFAPLSFGVYIIHEHPVIRDSFHKLFGWLIRLDTLPVIVLTLVFAVCIFVVCCLAEKVRAMLFSCLKFNEKVEKILLKIQEKCRKILTK